MRPENSARLIFFYFAEARRNTYMDSFVNYGLVMTFRTFILVIRRRVTVVKKGAGKVVSVAAVAIASLFLG